MPTPSGTVTVVFAGGMDSYALGESCRTLGDAVRKVEANNGIDVARVRVGNQEVASEDFDEFDLYPNAVIAVLTEGVLASQGGIKGA